MNLLRRLLAYLSTSPGGVREDHNPLAFWRYVRPSTTDVARDDELLDEAGGREVRSDVQDPAVEVPAEWRTAIDRVPAATFSASDEAVLRMFGGAHFGPNAKLILPSGTALGGDEAQALTSFYAPDSEHGGNPPKDGA